MKQKLQLQIPEPCHENWNSMTETQQGRFCMSCQKEVIDFSVMSDKEILGYISTASSNMCGRVADNQLNRFIETPRERKQYPFKYFWSILITSALISNESSGQILPPKGAVVNAPVDQKPPVIRIGKIAAPQKKDELNWVIEGKVVDEEGEPVPYASVTIKGTKEGTATNSNGFFSLKIKGNIDDIEMIVSSVGFIDRTVEFKKPENIKSLLIERKTVKLGIDDISLKRAVMEAVTVTANCDRRTGKVSLTTGMILVGTNVSPIEKIKSKFKEIAGINEIKVYPNPITSSSIFNILFNVKDLGEYALQFTDASGKIISSRQLSITSKNQLENFNSNIFQAHGIYFVSVRGRLNNKLYSTKLLVQ